MISATLVLVSGIVIFFLVYHFYARWVDKKVMEADPEKSTPARTYMDGVEFFPTNKNILFGFQFKGIAGLSPIVGPIIAIMWGWLPALLWIIFGTMLIGWVQDYFATMVSVRKDGQSLGPLTYSLIGPRTRKVILLFLVFYLLLVAAAFNALGADLFPANPSAAIPTLSVLVASVIVGVLIFRMKLSPVYATIIGLLVVIVGLYLGSIVPIVVANIDFWILTMLLVSIIAACTPIWRLTQPALYMFFYVVYFTLVALVISLIIGNPVYVRPAFTSFIAPNGWPLWPMMFVTVACGAISGWHSVVSSSATSKQIEKETDIKPVCAGSMFSEGLLALLALTIVSVLTASEATALGAPAAIFSKSGTAILGGSVLARALVGTMFVGLTLGILMLVIRIGGLTLSDIGGATPVLRNKYVAILVFSAIVFILASPSIGATWTYIWALFGGSNQLMAGLALWLATLYLIDNKKPWLITGIPGAFMIVTTIAALIITSHGVLTSGAVFYAKGELVKASGNIIAGIIGVVLIIAALIMILDISKAYSRRKSK